MRLGYAQCMHTSAQRQGIRVVERVDCADWDLVCDARSQHEFLDDHIVGHNVVLSRYFDIASCASSRIAAACRQ